MSEIGAEDGGNDNDGDDDDDDDDDEDSGDGKDVEGIISFYNA